MLYAIAMGQIIISHNLETAQGGKLVLITRKSVAYGNELGDIE